MLAHVHADDAQRLTVPAVDTFIADLHDALEESMKNPTGKGTMVQLYGTHLPSLLLGTALTPHTSHAGLGKVAGALAPSIGGQIATAFLDTLYKA